MRTLAVMILALLALSAFGQDLPAPDSNVGEPAVPPQEQSAAAADAEEAPRQVTPPPASRFTPTEKIRADDAVAFPVDI